MGENEKASKKLAKTLLGQFMQWKAKHQTPTDEHKQLSSQRNSGHERAAKREEDWYANRQICNVEVSNQCVENSMPLCGSKYCRG
jgi:hypothetical protein